MLSPYRKVLATRGALSFEFAGFLARLPISTMTLGIVLLVAGRTGSYGRAGVITAFYMVASGVSGPMLARFIDQLGQRRVIGPAFAGYVFGMVGLIVAVEADWPLPAPHVFAAIAGLAYPPVGSCIRARWTYVLDGSPLLHTAFSLESVIDETIFMTGPVIITLLATQVHEAAGLLAIVIASSIGAAWLITQRATEPPARGRAALRHGVPLGWRWLVPMVVAAVCLGSLFGSAEVVTVAFAQEHGHRGAAGVLLTIWATGSALAGIITGLVSWKSSPLKRFRVATVCLFALMCPLPFIDNIYVLAVMLFLAGFGVSPLFVSWISLVESLVPPSRLTEGITWILTGIGLGVAPGGALAGYIIDEHGASPAYFVAVFSGLIAMTIAMLVRPKARAMEPLSSQPPHPSQV